MTANDSPQLALPLPPLRPTISWARGDTTVMQCAWCGTLVAIPRKVRVLGPCPDPACTKSGNPTGDWWRQTVPVGPFDRYER